MSWDFLGKLTRPIGNFEEKILGNTPGGTPLWRLRQKLGEGFHHESGISNSQAIMLGAALGTGGAAAGGAFAGGGAATLGEGAAGAGAGIGGGSYSVVEGAPALGNGVEGGAMDMYGSQASPTDASTVFDPQATMKPSSSFKPNLSGGGGGGGSNMSPRPHDYLAYLQGSPQAAPFMPPAMGQGTFWGQQQPSPLKNGIFGLGEQGG